jgi:hypothetical protein
VPSALAKPFPAADQLEELNVDIHDFNLRLHVFVEPDVAKERR